LRRNRTREAEKTKERREFCRTGSRLSGLDTTSKNWDVFQETDMGLHSIIVSLKSKKRNGERRKKGQKREEDHIHRRFRRGNDQRRV